MDTISTSSTISAKDANHQKIFYIFLGLIVVLSLVYFIIVKQGLFKPNSLSLEARMGILEDLAAASASPTLTPVEQIEVLEDLKDTSSSPAVTQDDRYQILNDLAGK